ncbi:hypothetical protein EN808_17410 [Mesorhizobium sp. M8A.F.Ca.ET.165.01.1.1]|nr:hypothetical protein EN808_17410 [Mesorhizobium sp. M8A.F.Ca.ET.165.01.1.1]
MPALERPPSVLPDISPSRGEIGCRGRFRQSSTVESWRDGEAAFPSPLVGEGGLAKRGRMRGAPGNANVSLRWSTPQPSRRCAPIHLLPQGEKGSPTLSRHRSSIP